MQITGKKLRWMYVNECTNSALQKKLLHLHIVTVFTKRQLCPKSISLIDIYNSELSCIKSLKSRNLNEQNQLNPLLLVSQKKLSFAYGGTPMGKICFIDFPKRQKWLRKCIQMYQFSPGLFSLGFFFWLQGEVKFFTACFWGSFWKTFIPPTSLESSM